MAAHIASGADISTDGFNAVEAKNYLQGQGFTIEAKQEKFELTISAESIVSTDERFTMDNLSLGDNYKPLGACFRKANGEEIKRAYSKGERRNSNQTLPRIACQVFEKQLAAMSVEDKESFPICKYNPSNDMICGIYSSVDEFKKHRNTIEYLTYSYDNGRQFVIYCWNIFSTIYFVQECLKRFGNSGDQFVLTYREKDEKETETAETEAAVQEELVQQFKGYRNPYSSMLIESKNLIFRGAPGTGKSLEMLASLEDEELEAEAIRRMAALNREIASVEDLNENYQIGASYFLKLKTLNFDQLWTDYLQPLLHEYVQGMYDEDSLMSRFAKAYGYQKPSEGDAGEDTQG